MWQVALEFFVTGGMRETWGLQILVLVVVTVVVIAATVPSVFASSSVYEFERAFNL